jgi:hypothetical protein
MMYAFTGMYVVMTKKKDHHTCGGLANASERTDHR